MYPVDDEGKNGDIFVFRLSAMDFIKGNQEWKEYMKNEAKLLKTFLIEQKLANEQDFTEKDYGDILLNVKDNAHLLCTAYPKHPALQNPNQYLFLRNPEAPEKKQKTDDNVIASYTKADNVEISEHPAFKAWKKNRVENEQITHQINETLKVYLIRNLQKTASGSKYNLFKDNFFATGARRNTEKCTATQKLLGQCYTYNNDKNELEKRQLIHWDTPELTPTEVAALIHGNLLNDINRALTHSTFEEMTVQKHFSSIPELLTRLGYERQSNNSYGLPVSQQNASVVARL